MLLLLYFVIFRFWTHTPYYAQRSCLALARVLLRPRPFYCTCTCAHAHTQVMLRFGSFHTRREGTERANTGTASLCGKATEKVAPEASLKPGHRTPFWRIQAADGTKRGPAAGKGRSLRSGCGGPLFEGSRPLTAQKGVQQ